jgi:hypothetical protein
MSWYNLLRRRSAAAARRTLSNCTRSSSEVEQDALEAHVRFQRMSAFSMFLELREVPVELGPPVRHPSRHLRANPKDNLVGQIDEGAQARGHVAASWTIEAISGIRGRPLA